jgi:hypothetical protein
MLCMLLLEPGDGVLTEQYSYSHLVEHTLKLHGNHALPVAMDALGVQPDALRAVLQVGTIVACHSLLHVPACCFDCVDANVTATSLTTGNPQLSLCIKPSVETEPSLGCRVFGRNVGHRQVWTRALVVSLQAARAAGGRQPRVFYTVPTGQNPTGLSAQPSSTYNTLLSSILGHEHATSCW